MNKYRFSDLLQYEDKVKNLFSTLGINYSSECRINKYFQYLRLIDSNRSLNKDEFHKLINNDKVKFYYCQYYVLEICKILDSIDNNFDKRILVEKLTNITKGSYLLSEENENNTIARDTTFELSLFAFFKNKGLESSIYNTNPDLKLKTDNFTYNIECKRPASNNSLEKSIKKAFKQLNKNYKDNIIPTIALSLEHILLGGELILHSKDEHSSLEFLSNLLYNFSMNNKIMLSKICGSNPCLVLYYLSCLSGFSDKDLPMANATYIVGNVFNFKSGLSEGIYNDLSRLGTSED